MYNDSQMSCDSAPLLQATDSVSDDGGSRDEVAA